MTAGADELWSPSTAPDEDGRSSHAAIQGLARRPDPSPLLLLRSLRGCRGARSQLWLDLGQMCQESDARIHPGLLARESCSMRGA